MRWTDERNDQTGGDLADDRLFAKITWRLLPLLLACYVVAFIDRVNISYAQLGMAETLRFTPDAFAIGAGMFFVGYLLFEIPSNMLLERIGVRKTLLRIMCCWSLLAVAMCFVRTEAQLYVLRFLLGVFEAGFFPGVVLYLTYWYPPDRRGRVFGIFTTAIVVAPIIAAPLSGAILRYCDGAFGLHGWQWLFLLQGLPACVLGLVAFLALSDTPAQVSWLCQEEKARLADRLLHPDRSEVGHRAGGVRQLLADPTVLLLAAANVMFSGAGYALVFWLPSLIKSWGVRDPFHVGLHAMVPSLFALAGMILIGRSSDRRGDRRWHFAGAAGLAAAGLLASVAADGRLLPSLVSLGLIGFGQAALLPIYTTITSSYVPRSIAAAGIALLACVGHIGSAVTPAIVTRANAAWGGSAAGLCLMAFMYVSAALLVLRALKPDGARAG